MNPTPQDIALAEGIVLSSFDLGKDAVEKFHAITLTMGGSLSGEGVKKIVLGVAQSLADQREEIRKRMEEVPELDEDKTWLSGWNACREEMLEKLN